MHCHWQKRRGYFICRSYSAIAIGILKFYAPDKSGGRLLRTSLYFSQRFKYADRYIAA